MLRTNFTMDPSLEPTMSPSTDPTVAAPTDAPTLFEDHQAMSLAEIVSIIYISCNALITLHVSILGVKYVREEAKRRKELVMMNSKRSVVPPNIVIDEDEDDDDDAKSMEILPALTLSPIRQQNKTHGTELLISRTTSREDSDEKHIYDDKNDALEDQVTVLSKMGFMKLWSKLVWRMRYCYTSLIVHLFDVFTDILVIIEWWFLESKYGDKRHVDPRAMSICAIIVMSAYKVASTLAFWKKDRSLYRTALQFFDLLIFEEILSTHRKITAEFSKRNYDEKATEPTTSFKYIRSLEAIFESIPQCILQTTFFIRTGGDYQGDYAFLIISLFSIFQSIVSMTSSILKQDNLYMNYPKFRKHLRSMPPTPEFFAHALCRFSEVLYRIALLSLLWAACGGLMFSFVFLAEVVGMFILMQFELGDGEFFAFGDLIRAAGFEVSVAANWEDVFSRLQALVIIPTELMFAKEVKSYDKDASSPPQQHEDSEESNWEHSVRLASERCGHILRMILSTIWRCTPIPLLSTHCSPAETIYYLHPTLRLGVSFVEWIVVIYGGVYWDNNRFMFFKPYFASIFLIGFVLFLFFVNTQYLYLMPRFVLPHGVSIRSKWGYAFNGELDEMRRVEELYLKRKEKEFGYRIKNMDWEEAVEECGKEMQMRKENEDKSKRELWNESVFDTVIEEKIKKGETIEVKVRVAIPGTSAVMFALANGHAVIVEWLEARGANKHVQLLKECKAFSKNVEKEFGNILLKKREWNKLSDDARSETLSLIKNQARAYGHRVIAEWMRRLDPESLFDTLYEFVEESSRCNVMSATLARMFIDPEGSFYSE